MTFFTIPGWIYAVLIVLAVYLIYITITQPEAGFRIFTAIFQVLGKIFYFIAIAIYKVALFIIRLFSRVFGGKK
jgi:hypothetical protein